MKHKARDFVSFDEKCENPRKNSRDEIMESVGIEYVVTSFKEYLINNDFLLES